MTTLPEVFILLLAAHCYGDFLLQTGEMAGNKHRARPLFIHSGVHALVAYLVLQDWTEWRIPLAVFLAHAVIDRGKACFSPTPRAFALDQLAHVLSLAGIALLAARWGWISEGFSVDGRRWIIVGAGFFAAIYGAGYFISRVAGEMVEGNGALREALAKGLPGGGARIGRLERALIFLFMAIGFPAGIGFLIAAKSILRFEEAKQQNVSEYVLIGTLWSFGLAIAISWVTLRLAGGFL